MGENNMIPEGFVKAEQEMMDYFSEGEKAYQTEIKEGLFTVTDTISEYWADIELEKASDWKFCIDEDVPETGLIRLFYGDREWELVFLNDTMMEEIVGVRQIRLVAFRKTANISDY